MSSKQAAPQPTRSPSKESKASSSFSLASVTRSLSAKNKSLKRAASRSLEAIADLAKRRSCPSTPTKSDSSRSRLIPSPKPPRRRISYPILLASTTKFGSSHLDVTVGGWGLRGVQQHEEQRRLDVEFDEEVFAPVSRFSVSISTLSLDSFPMPGERSSLEPPEPYTLPLFTPSSPFSTFFPSSATTAGVNEEDTDVPVRLGAGKEWDIALEGEEAEWRW